MTEPHTTPPSSPSPPPDPAPPASPSPPPDPFPPAQPYPPQPYPPQQYAAQPYPAPSYSPQPYPAPSYPAQAYAPQPYPGQPGQEGTWPPTSAPPAAAVPRKRRTGLIISIVLAAALMLCGGGGVAAYLIVQNAQPSGSTDPAAAIEGFLTAVFTEHDAVMAAKYVCPTARDEKQLEQLVFEVKTFEEKYESARTSWQYDPVQPAGVEARATVKLTLTTQYEQVAEKQIRLLLVDQRGWWVCDVEAAS